MQVILTKDIDTLGAKNEVVRVKDGYARNYLLPRNFAIPANKGNLKMRSKHIEAAQAARDERVAAAQEVAGKLHNKSFVILAKASKEGKLFGSVTGQDIVGCVFAFTGIEINKNMINLLSPIKLLGVYQVNIKLTQGVTASIKIDVRADEVPAEDELPPEGEGFEEYPPEVYDEAGGEPLADVGAEG